MKRSRMGFVRLLHVLTVLALVLSLVPTTVSAALPAIGSSYRVQPQVPDTSTGALDRQHAFADEAPTMEKALVGASTATSAVDDLPVLLTAAPVQRAEAVASEPPVDDPKPIPVATPITTADSAVIGPGGGHVSSPDRRVFLTFPAGAVQAPITVTISRAARDATTPDTIFYHFSVQALDTRDSPVRAFAQPITATVLFQASELAGRQGSPALFWLDETKGDWQPLGGRVDWGQGTVSAAITHFSTFGLSLLQTPTYGVQDLPSVHGFVSDDWTGNSSVHYPLALPPGPGALNLALTLDYSSENVNSIRGGNSDGDLGRLSSFDRQASTLGWGWSLGGLGQISNDLPRGRTFVSGPGLSGELKDVGSSWQTEPQAFLKINHDAEAADAALRGWAWEVWAPDGTSYLFGDRAGEWGNGIAWSLATDGNGACYKQMREARLTEVTDTHGNKAKITYATELRDISSACNGGYTSYVRAIYPTRLEYFRNGDMTNATVRVQFTYTDSRPDTDVTGATNPYQEVYWSTNRLTTITMSVRTGTGADDFSTVRSYVLANNHYLYPPGGNESRSIMVLDSITARGQLGTSLPAWTFTYERISPYTTSLNAVLMTAAYNGQGGSVGYVYVDQTFIAAEGCGNTNRFRVNMQGIDDGAGAIARTVFVSQGGWAHSDGGGGCPNFEFVGYGNVERRLMDGNDNLYQVTINFYHQTSGGGALDPKRGMIYQTQVKDAIGGTVIAQTNTTWQHLPQNGTNWVRKNDDTSWSGSSNSAHTTRYLYEPNQQNGTQYGNVTHVKESLDTSATVYRTTETWYYPNTNPYIVNRPARQVLSIGNAGGTCMGDVRYFYDGNTGYDQLPTTGDVTMQRTVLDSCSDPTQFSDVQTSYDSYGNATSRTDPNNNQTTTAYDTTAGSWPMLYAYPTSMTQPLVGVTTYTWNKVLGQVTRVVDPNSAITSYLYDDWGRQTKMWQPGEISGTTSATIEMVYTNYGGGSAPFTVQKRQLETQGGATYLDSWTFYDGVGRIIQTQAETATANQSVLVSSAYNPRGQVMKQTVPYVYGAAGGAYRTPDWTTKTQYDYDRLGRPQQITNTDNTTVLTSYNVPQPGVLQTALIDAGSHMTIQETDTLGRMTIAKQYQGIYYTPNWGAPPYATAQYSYDVADRLTRVIDPINASTWMTYNLAGVKTGMTDPDMGTWGYAYDAAGNLTRQTDARGQTICFYYDTLERLTGKHYRADTSCPGTPSLNVSYMYDSTANGNFGKGRRTGMSDQLISASSWEYSQSGRTITETTVISGTGGGTLRTVSAYDPAQRLAWMTYPGGSSGEIGELVTTAYDSGGRPYSLSGASTYVAETQYTAWGAVDLRKLGPSGAPQIWVDNVYYGWSGNAGNSQVRLQQIMAGPQSGLTALQNLTYSYDAAGDVSRIVDANAGQAVSFFYDALMRPWYASGAYNRGYSYDAAGNITYSDDGGESYFYDPVKVHQVISTDIGNSYGYDANGNMTSRIVAGTSYTLTYDQESRLTGATRNGTPLAAFWYNGDGQRVKGTVNGVTSLYVGDYYEVAGGAVKTYYSLGGQRVAINDGGTLRFLLGDHLGSTSVAADSTTGAKLGEVRYYLWGGERYTSGSTPTTYRYTGQRNESELGLMYYGARWYDPALGRWAQADTIVPQPGNPQSLNRYTYVNNNPLKYVDPSGHWTDDELERILGKDWYKKYFEGGIFGDRTPEQTAALLKFLHSAYTTDLNVLHMVGVGFGAMDLVHSQLGVSFHDVSAVDVRASLSFGGAGFAGLSWDLVFNINSGEITLFESPEVGVMFGAGVDAVIGIAFVKDMSNNEGFKGAFYAMGAVGAHTIAINLEQFHSAPMSNPNNTAKGTFVGGGLGEALGFYLTVSYSYVREIYDYNGATVFERPSIPTIIGGMAGAIWKDTVSRIRH